MVDTTTSWLEELKSTQSSRSGSNSERSSSRRAEDAVAFLSGGFPDRRVLPKDTVTESTRLALEREGEWALQYGPSGGDPGLIRELLKKLKRDQGIEAGPENILISAGASQAVSIATTMLVEPGDVVISEAPTWTGAVRKFRSAGADIREVRVDDEGTNVEELERILSNLKAEGKQPKMLYIIPNFQNPKGVTTTLDRRKQIIALANEYGVPIMEDDAYFDLRYEGDYLPTLYSLDETGSIMYMGTFSKNMAAGMRLGWTVAHPDVIRRMVGLKFEGGTNMFASHVAAEWTGNGTLAAHVKSLRTFYHRHRDVMLAALEREMPEGTTWTRPQGGFFIWVTLPEGGDIRRLAPALAERGVSVSPGPNFYFSDSGEREFRLSYSFPTEAEINTGIEILGQFAKAQLTER